MKTLILQVNTKFWNSAFHLLPLFFKSDIAGRRVSIIDFWIFRLNIFQGSLPEYIASMNAEARKAELALAEWESISKHE